MQLFDFFKRLTHLKDTGELPLTFKALRQDTLIWESYLSLAENAEFAARFVESSVPLNAGIIGLYSLGLETEQLGLKKRKLPVEMLEKVMFGFESYLQSEKPVNSLEDATMLALALVEKRKASESWKNVILDILSRMKIGNADRFEQYWGSILAITANLIDDKEELLKDLSTLQQTELVMGLLVHIILCLPASEEGKADLFKRFLYALSPQVQTLSLKQIKLRGGIDLCRLVAARLVEKYLSQDFSRKNPSEYWKNPVAATQYAFQCQAAGDVALLADDRNAALQLNQKSMEILSALILMGRVKQAAISHTALDSENLQSFSQQELSDPELSVELAYVNDDLNVHQDDKAYPVKTLLQSKHLMGAGQSELAREAVRESLNQLTDEQIEETLIKGPKYTQSWDPKQSLETLNSLGVFDESSRMASLLLKQNPTDFDLNLAAATAFDGKGDFSSALKHWEMLALLDPESPLIKRKLVKSLMQNGNIEDAFEIANLLVEAPEKDEEDLETLGEIAIKLEKPQDALEASGKLLEKNPDHINALTITGIAYRMLNQPELALDSLKKASNFSGSDPRPWLETADILWQEGEQESALRTLREGLAANPRQRDLVSMLASRLMEQGSIAEAYPFLKDLSGSGADLDIDLLLIDAMKALGETGGEEVLEVITKRYPQEQRFAGEYGVELVRNGKKAKGLAVLKELKDSLIEKPAWAIAYVEALLTTDYEHLVPNQVHTEIEITNAVSLLRGILLQQPDDLYVKTLLGECYLRLSEYTQAFTMLSQSGEIPETGLIAGKTRIQAGLSQAAARVNQADVASAALDQAIQDQPDWLGLRRIKAENLHLAGDDDKAVTEVAAIVGENAQRIETIMWAVQFLRSIGRITEATSLVAEKIEKFPDNLDLLLAKAEVELVSGQLTFNPDEEAKLKSLLDSCEDEDNLIRAAVIFANLENQADTVAYLEKAAGLGSLAARLNLAGLYRITGEPARAMQTLETIEPNSLFVNLIRKEICNAEGEGQPVEDEFTREEFLASPIQIEEAFLPRQWKEIFESSNPATSQFVRAHLQTGNPIVALDRVKGWVESEPENLEARVYAVETALACSAMEEYAQFLVYEPSVTTGAFYAQYSLLQREMKLDGEGNRVSENKEVTIFESVTANEPLQIARVREMVAEGNFTDAEMLYQMAVNVFVDHDHSLYVCQLGIQRNLLKAAVDVNRWHEAFQLCQQMVEENPNNQEVGLLRLETLVSGVEFSNTISGLEVTTHALRPEDIDQYVKINIMSYADYPQNRQEYVKRWLLRGNLAITPTKDNIRALAMLTPHPDDAAVMMAGLRKIGQSSTAIQVARKFADAPCVLLELAMCEAESDIEKAIDTLQRSLQSNPSQPVALRLLSSYQERIGQLLQAADTIEEALSNLQNEPRWHVKAAELWEKLGNFEKAVEHLQLAEKIDPGDNEIEQRLGEALLSIKQPVESLKHLLAAAGKDQARHELWEAISEAYLMNGDLNLSLEAAEKAISVDPSAVKAHLQAGKVSWNKGELEKALDQVRLAISLDPEDAENYVFLAKLQKEQGNVKQALKTLEKASQSKNASVATMIEHASMVRDIEGATAARDLTASFSQKFPENPELLKLLAEAEEACGNINEAERVAAHALEMHPDEPELFMLLGKINEKMGNLDQAAHYFSQAVAHRPGKIDGYLKLSEIFTSQREFGKARKVLEQGLENGNGDIRLYLTSANLLKEAKDYQGAEQMLRKASALDPRNLNIHRQLGAVLALNMVHQSQEVSSQT